MGNSIKEQYNKYNKETDVILNIKLNKTCYFPGESITGFLDIQPKISLKETIFDNTSATFNLIQLQQYFYSVGSGDDKRTYYVGDDSDILFLNIDFINFKGSNILSGINIPFSFQIPLNILPSVYFHGYYIKHFICFELPGIKAKRSLMIIIKEFQSFTLENKLLKMPAIGFGDFYKKKKSKYKGGKVSCLLKIPKNSYSYLESIPFEIFLDCTELNMEVKSVKITLMKNTYFNDKKNNQKHFITNSKDELVLKEFTFLKNLDKYYIKDEIQFPQENNNFENSIQKEIYLFLENMKTIEVDYYFPDKELKPFCIGGLISILFSLRVGIIYKEKRSISYFELPIQLLDGNSINLKIYNPNLNDNISNNLINPIKNTNINSLDESDKIIEESDDFVVINHQDFEKLFFEGK